jgi:opacity protein-like surface antigen
MKKLLLISATALLCAQSASALDLAVAPRLGTQGAGLDLVTGLTDRINLRLGAYRYSYDRDIDSDDATYRGDLKLLSAGLMADYHPFAGHFRLTLGGFYNGNKLDITAKPNASGNYVFNGTSYSASDFSGSGQLTFKKFAPYAGIGGGNAIRGGSWSFMWDVGALYQNKGTVKLNAQILNTSVTPAMQAQFQSDLLKEQQSLQDDVNDYKWYPVISLGLAYRF